MISNKELANQASSLFMKVAKVWIDLARVISIACYVPVRSVHELDN
jgi:hypothetical protein